MIHIIGTALQFFHKWGVLIAAGLILSMGGYIKFLHWRLDVHKNAAKESSQQLELCVKQHATNEEIVDDYRKKIDTLGGRVNALKLRNNQCVKITPAPKGGDGKARSGHAGQDGLPVGELLDYAAECERIRLQLGAAQRYIGAGND